MLSPREIAGFRPFIEHLGMTSQRVAASLRHAFFSSLAFLFLCHVRISGFTCTVYTDKSILACKMFSYWLTPPNKS